MYWKLSTRNPKQTDPVRVVSRARRLSSFQSWKNASIVWHEYKLLGGRRISFLSDVDLDAVEGVERRVIMYFEVSNF